MRTRGKVIALVLGLALGLASSAGAQPPGGQPPGSLTEQVDNLEVQVEGLEADVDGLDVRVTTLEALPPGSGGGLRIVDAMGTFVGVPVGDGNDAISFIDGVWIETDLDVDGFIPSDERSVSFLMADCSDPPQLGSGFLVRTASPLTV